jgi:hypothetical protein
MNLIRDYFRLKRALKIANRFSESMTLAAKNKRRCALAKKRRIGTNASPPTNHASPRAPELLQKHPSLIGLRLAGGALIRSGSITTSFCR